MNLQQLRAICEVVGRELNISEAARALYASQPAISKQIRSFEIEMRTMVFARSKGRLTSLTPAGRRIVEAAQSALEAVAEIQSICGSEGDAVPRRFLIAASRSLARDFLPHVIEKFVARYPGVEITIVHGSLAQMTRLLLDGEVSLAITIENGTESNKIVALPFDEVPRIVVVPHRHALLDAGELTLSAMSPFPFVLYDDSYAIRREVLKVFQDNSIRPKIAVTASGAEVIKAYVALGIGIAVLTETAFDPVIDAQLHAIPADHLFPRAVTRLLLSQNHFLRKFEYDFIKLCAPAWTESKITEAFDERASMPVVDRY